MINTDDALVTELAEQVEPGRHKVKYHLSAPQSEDDYGLLQRDGQTWLAKGSLALIPVSSLRLQGQHNVANALAALALGATINLPIPAMLAALQQFAGLPHRTQWVAKKQGVNWVNDSKATNVGATIAAVNGLSDRPLIVLMGGQGKEQDFSPLVSTLEACAKLVILFGEDANLIANVLDKHVDYVVVESLSQAIHKAHEVASTGDLVLLSPACASFDMFSGYEQRGEVFTELVRELPQ